MKNKTFKDKNSVRSSVYSLSNFLEAIVHAGSPIISARFDKFVDNDLTLPLCKLLVDSMGT